MEKKESEKKPAEAGIKILGIMATLIIAVIVAMAAVLEYISGKCGKQDNALEEACEELLKVETGGDIDLSPDSPEVKNKLSTIESLKIGVV